MHFGGWKILYGMTFFENFLFNASLVDKLLKKVLSLRIAP
jgi:hypothetical protein